ncbi:MAG: tRNA (adenosine(37)-N6)-threonylcarbamoyltransferase complex ATPase subunit type 1 TsaE [Gammaproteobacteria bacterium]
MQGTLSIQDLAALDELAQDSARVVGLAPVIIHLAGPLGVGKTTFVRFWLRHLGISDTVRSPSFTLLECYDWEGQKIVHTDLFRLRGPRELENLGLRDYVGEALIFIEWPERGEWATPPPDVHFAFEYDGSGRRVTIASSI